MNDQGNVIFFFHGLIKNPSKDNSVLEKSPSMMIPHVSNVAQDQSEGDGYMLASFYVTR